MILPCTHSFHTECVAIWRGIKQECPLCRYQLGNDDMFTVRSCIAKRLLHGQIELQIVWDNGEKTWEPLTGVAHLDCVVPFLK